VSALADDGRERPKPQAHAQRVQGQELRGEQEMPDLTDQTNAVELLKASKSDKEWNAACDAIKEANGGYPSWWYMVVIAQRLPQEVAAKWQGDGSLHVTKL